MPDPIDAATLAECLLRLGECEISVQVRGGTLRCNSVGVMFVSVWGVGGAIGNPDLTQIPREHAHDAMLRTCVEELIRLANEEGATVTQRDTAYQAWCDLARNVRTPLLAAVDAVCRLREEARRA